jgi:hypothetical protein
MQVPIVQPLRVIETPTNGVGAHVSPPSDNPDETVELHYVLSAKESSTYET